MSVSYGAHDGAQVAGGFSQGSLGGLHVQLGQLFHAGQGFGAQVKQAGDLGFLGGEDLFNGHHGGTPKRKKSTGTVERRCDRTVTVLPTYAALQHEQIIVMPRASASLFCCAATS